MWSNNLWERPYKRNRHVVDSCQYRGGCCPKYCHSVLNKCVEARLKETIWQTTTEFQATVFHLDCGRSGKEEATVAALA